ncbi:GTP pyrophosphokinase family protein [Kitasatospora sp. NPDC056800]|uniref:GTP pyrophosphokinase n=1 Tax=Kitasatospora sp. NPDC056800 TaxID=3345948 RepID=UPI0036B67067
MPNGLPFSYQQFSDWYDTYKKKYLDTAKEASSRALSEHLESQLSEMEAARVRVSGSRVKSKSRVWRKLNLPKYKDSVEGLESIPEAIDDLVGLRITCNNHSDVARVADLIRSLPASAGSMESALTQDPDSWKDYSGDPKPSGYRAVHVNLKAPISWAVDWHFVTCELQIRTLLQDGWGELTHEDTYKPGSEPPALVKTLSRRMADLLAAVDDIAQDLREELDRISTEAVGEAPESTPTIENGERADTSTERINEFGFREAAMRYLRERLDALSRPIDLASLAWELQREFGQEVSQGWFGFPSFKALVRASHGSVAITDQPPAYVIPDGFIAPSAPHSSASSSDVPDVATAMRRLDRNLPVLSKGQLRAACERLSVATNEADWNKRASDLARVNDLTRRAREAEVDIEFISRTNLDYIAKALLFSGKLKGPLTPADVMNIYCTWTVKRLDGIVALEEEERAALEEWLS